MNTFLYEGWIGPDYFNHCSEQYAKHWSKHRASGKTKITGNTRSSQRQCLQSRARKQKKCSTPRSSEARDMQDNGNALEQTTPGTEIQVNLEVCKNLAFEWGLCTTPSTYFFPLLELKNWRGEQWCENNSHHFGTQPFKQHSKTRKPQYSWFFICCAISKPSNQMLHCLLDKWYIEKTESHKVDREWAIEKRTIRNSKCFSCCLVNTDHYSNVTFCHTL